MQRQITFFMALAVAASAVAPLPAYGADLELATVLSRVVTQSPRLAAFASRQREADARTIQAAMPPNPNLQTAVENIAGSGTFSGPDQAETTVRLSQRFELGGKRAERRRAAELESELATWDYEHARAAALHEAVLAFIDVLAEQQLLILAGEAVDLADQVITSVRRRVNAGSSSDILLTRAEIAHGTAQLEREQRKRVLKAAHQRLAATWGATRPDFERVAGTFGAIQPIPIFETLQAQLNDNPEIARWKAELEHREALVELEESRAIPDVTIGAGYRRLSGPDESALVAELTVPVPLFDRNQGAIGEARERALRASHERHATEVGLDTELAEAYEALVTARAESQTLEQVILPGASKTFDGLRAGFREGRFDYLEVLDAQRTLVATRSRRVHAFADYHQAIATIERLTGKEPTAGLSIARTEQEQTR